VNIDSPFAVQIIEVRMYVCMYVCGHSFIHSFWRLIWSLFKRLLLRGTPSPVTDKEGELQRDVKFVRVCKNLSLSLYISLSLSLPLFISVSLLSATVPVF